MSLKEVEYKYILKEKGKICIEGNLAIKNFLETN